MSTFSTVPPSFLTTLRNVSSDGAMVRSSRIGVEDDHDFVMAHAAASPPVDSRRPRTVRGRRVDGPDGPCQTCVSLPDAAGCLRWSACRLAADRPSLLGAHVHAERPGRARRGRSAPRWSSSSWPIRRAGRRRLGAAPARRRAGRASDLAVYVHAPYVVNVATLEQPDPDPEPQDARPARRRPRPTIGAKGLIVHGGHVGASDDPRDRVSTTGARPSPAPARRAASRCRS